MSAALKHVRSTIQVDEEPVNQIGKVILDHRIDSAAHHGMTPLMCAVCDGSEEDVRALLDQGAQVNAKRDDGFTALSLAAFFGRTEIVKLLLAKGADIRSTTRGGTSAEMWANAKGFQAISELLQAARDETSKRGGASLKVVKSEPDKFSNIENNPEPRTLPDVIDLEPASAPAFHPGHVFLSRITSSTKSLTALLVAVTIALVLVIFSIYQIGRALTAVDAATTPTDHPAAPENRALAQPSQNATENEEQSSAAVTVDSEPAGEASDRNASKPSDEALSTSASDSAVSPVSVWPSSQKAKPATRNVSSDGSANNGLANSSFSRLSDSAHAEKTIAQEPAAAESDTDAKPAPLSIEQKPVAATNKPSPDEAPRDQGSRSAPLGITSGKPKSKVIQWP